MKKSKTSKILCGAALWGIASTAHAPSAVRTLDLESGVGLHPFIENNLRSFGSPIPFIRSLAASLKLWHGKNTAVNSESVSSTRKAASVRFH